MINTPFAKSQIPYLFYFHLIFMNTLCALAEICAILSLLLQITHSSCTKTAIWNNFFDTELFHFSIMIYLKFNWLHVLEQLERLEQRFLYIYTRI